MKTATVRNSNEAFEVVAHMLATQGKPFKPNGHDLLGYLSPIALTIERPLERPLFSGLNPIDLFHNAVETFGQQLEMIGAEKIEELKKDPVPSLSTSYGNTTLTYQRNAQGRLDLIQYSMNENLCGPVDGSLLLEYLSAKLGLAIGLHYLIYANVFIIRDALAVINVLGSSENQYTAWMLEPSPLVRDVATFEKEFALFLKEGTRIMGYKEPWIRKVLGPMTMAKHAMVENNSKEALRCVKSLPSNDDWRFAVDQWIKKYGN